MLTIDLEKLPSYRIGERRGMEKGIEKGLEQGIEKGLEQGLEKGMEKGAHEKAQSIAKELLNAGIPPTQVVTFTQLTLAEIEGLKKGQMDA